MFNEFQNILIFYNERNGFYDDIYGKGIRINVNWNKKQNMIHEFGHTIESYRSESEVILTITHGVHSNFQSNHNCQPVIDYDSE